MHETLKILFPIFVFTPNDTELNLRGSHRGYFRDSIMFCASNFDFDRFGEFSSYGECYVFKGRISTGRSYWSIFSTFTGETVVWCVILNFKVFRKKHAERRESFQTIFEYLFWSKNGDMRKMIKYECCKQLKKSVFE